MEPTVETQAPAAADARTKKAVPDQSLLHPTSELTTHETRHARARTLVDRFAEVNKELWLILSMLVIAAVLNYLVTGHRMVLGIYTLPTLFSAYVFGRRHAVLTAFASIVLVVLLSQINPQVLGAAAGAGPVAPWLDMVAWGGMLIITAYAMGTLYERHESRMAELRSTYRGLLMILRQFIGRDKHTESHCYRVSVYATRLAARMRLSVDRIDDVQAASLLHDIGKMDISRDLLEKASSLSQEEYAKMKTHVAKAGSMLEPVSGPLHRILPIILAHHEHFDGTGYEGIRGEDIPIEARIIAVADAFDAMTSDRPYRRAMSTFEAKDIIVAGAGEQFDPDVVRAFMACFQRGEMEAPQIVV